MSLTLAEARAMVGGDVGAAAFADMRKDLGRYFDLWDLAVRNNDTTAAKSVRKALLARTMQMLPAAASLPGWYMFVDLDRPTISAAHYVGIAETNRRPLRNRIVDRLRDDSCLDVALDDLPEEEQRRAIEKRLVTALPSSGAKYVEQHLKTARQLRQISHVLMVSTNEDVRRIKEVEHLLIASGVFAGAPLSNKKARQFRVRPSSGAPARAITVLEQFRNLGLPKPASVAWMSSLLSLTVQRD